MSQQDQITEFALKERRLFFIEEVLRYIDSSELIMLNFMEYAQMCKENYNISLELAKEYIRIAQRRINNG